jgi:hypothetical protein
MERKVAYSKKKKRKWRFSLPDKPFTQFAVQEISGILLW